MRTVIHKKNNYHFSCHAKFPACIITFMPVNRNKLSSIEFSDNAIRVLESRYLQKNEKGEICETPTELIKRVATSVAEAELNWGGESQQYIWEKKFFDIINQLLFLPNSPTLMNAGTAAGQLSACFVLPLEDHLEDIFSTLKLAALIQQSGGGTGFNFSHLRPKNDILYHAQGAASGPVSFMKIFDISTEHVKQGGKRRGANMGILNIDHPDIEEFITCKSIEGNLRNFNISIGISDAFMMALQRDDHWSLIHPNSHVTTKTIKAKYLWDLIVHNAWKSGDPGLLFLDTINESNPIPHVKRIEATNPCGEVPLLPYESCNLGSINLSQFVDPDKETLINWRRLEETVHISVRFLDNVIEVNRYLSPQIKKTVQGNRKIGLGLMGWSETLARLEIPYESDEAIHLAERVMKFIAEKSFDASASLAKERGSFRNWKKSIYYPATPIRNATRTSIAPTGTISILADTSSSIEPFFALSYERQHVLHNETLKEINKPLLQYLKKHQMASQDILNHIEQTGTLEKVSSLPQSVKNIFKTALEIHPFWHLKHQEAFQKYTDNAVSKTINLPQHATPSDIDHIYQQAWRSKLKGITIFRYNSRERQVLKQGIISDVKSCKVCIE
ncbi:adenosylcobalamin-dependent ribonucleoside-diphosphate reductase [Chryseolinea sp. H1M3-3]|uniref:adenosylcobalamin-dependent ribonucleoside-diphosphate reductase n=1 Tax=Chryseolinea sp. H1M3-3 TaxID=3034144 RepID=UPI0023EB43E0|nr:adenosylcobalamin-dependent ribonucleoside-diphosphate reductase [Chryseolinea sp. H1M3-3]